MTFRFGSTILDSVEIYNCSQIDTEKAAIRFEQAAASNSQISNCAIHNGLGWGIKAKKSNNIKILDNVIFNFRPIGVNLQSVMMLEYSRNVLLHVVLRPYFPGIDMMGGVFTCSNPVTNCRNIKMTDNIVAGVPWTGYTARAHECGDYSSTTFKNNIGHSVKFGGLGGHGALIYPDPNVKADCQEMSHFIGYKNHKTGAYGGYHAGPSKWMVTNMIGIDNVLGIGGGLSFGGEGGKVEINDNLFVGESPIDDCAIGARRCFEMGKSGFSTTSVEAKDHMLHP